jgi:hypothetical protein
MSVQLLSPVSNHYTIYYSTYVYGGVRCVCVCVMRGGGRGESFPVAAVKVKSLNPLVERGSSTNNERPGNHPSSTQIQH